MNSKFIMQDMSANMYENRSKRSDKSPDFSGTIKVGNKEYSLSLWFSNDKQGKPKVTRFGGRMLSGKIGEPKDKPKDAGDGDNINDMTFSKPKDKKIEDFDTGLF